MNANRFVFMLQIFNGNSDQHTLVTNMLERPFIAKCVRVNPLSWSEYTSLRFDLIGCPVDAGIHLYYHGANVLFYPLSLSLSLRTFLRLCIVTWYSVILFT